MEDPVYVHVRRDGEERIVREERVLPTDFVVASDDEVTEMRALLAELPDRIRWLVAQLANETTAHAKEVERLTGDAEYWKALFEGAELELEQLKEKLGPKPAPKVTTRGKKVIVDAS